MSAPRIGLLAVFAGLTLLLLLGCLRPPDDRTVHAIIESDVKRLLEPQLGPVKVTVKKFGFGNSFTRTDRDGTKRTYFPCTATYTTVDARGNTGGDAPWVADFAKSDGKWIVVSHSSGATR